MQSLFYVIGSLSLVHCQQIKHYYSSTPIPWGNSDTSLGERLGDRLCENHEQFYHNETRKCYFPTRTESADKQTPRPVIPCGSLQHFYKASEDYGACDCVWKDDMYPWCHGHGSSKIIDRPVLNWPGSGRCYYAYEQGPCESHEWVLMNPNTFQSECQPNPCRNRTLQKPFEGLYNPPKDPMEVFWFLKNGTCYQAFTRAFCGNDEYVRFWGTHANPLCNKKKYGPGACPYTVETMAELPCAQGLKPVGNDCVAVARFD